MSSKTNACQFILRLQLNFLRLPVGVIATQLRLCSSGHSSQSVFGFQLICRFYSFMFFCSRFLPFVLFCFLSAVALLDLTYFDSTA